MQAIDLLLSARWVLPIAPHNEILEQHSVAIHQGRIVDVLPTSQALQRYTTTEHREFPQHALMPGLVNAHAHTPMNLFRGLADDLPLMDWLNQHIWPAEKALINPESVTVGSRLAIAEMIRGGTTCFNDNYFFPDVTAQVAIEEGIRATLGCIIMSVPTEWAQDEDSYFTRAQHVLTQAPQSPLIRWTFCPHAPYTVSNNSLLKIKTLAAELALPIHMHVHETAFEVEQSLREHQCRPLARLDQLGLLNERFIAVHMTQLTDEEIQRVADTGTHVVHCPESNLKLASGMTPIRKLLDAGVNVALGTDGAASNNDLDLWGELRTAAILAKTQSQDPTTLPAPQALAMATLHGARAIGLEKEIGSLEAGKSADVIAIDLGHYFTQPIYDPRSHLAYAMNRLQVSDVWVAGRALLKGGEFTHLDTQRLIDQAQSWADRAKPFAV